jgi:hypothetical protein
VRQTGLPCCAFLARNVHKYSCDQRIYIHSCDCPVASRINLLPIAISPRVRLVRGIIQSTYRLLELKRWVILNKTTLLRHWSEDIDIDRPYVN